MFDRSYEVVLADTEAARRIHYQIRYQVYCLEKGYEDECSHSKYERDEWDDQSVHFIVRTKQSREWIAAMRMVIPETGPLPVEQLCRVNPIATPSFSGESVAEISRMCVIDSHRRNMHSEPPSSRRSKSVIMKGLLRAAAVYSQENNIPYWYFLTTPALARMINRLNVQLIKVGSACNHRGIRYPFLANLKDAVQEISEGCPDMSVMLKNKAAAYRRFTELDLPREIEPAVIHCQVA